MMTDQDYANLLRQDAGIGIPPARPGGQPSAQADGTESADAMVAGRVLDLAVLRVLYPSLPDGTTVHLPAVPLFSENSLQGIGLAFAALMKALELGLIVNFEVDSPVRAMMSDDDHDGMYQVTIWPQYQEFYAETFPLAASQAVASLGDVDAIQAPPLP